jgi:hypothetical protein
MRALVTRLTDKLSVIFSLLGLLQLLILVFALLGMQLFGGQLKPCPDCEADRSNFDSFGWAYLTVFQVLTGENWNEVMYSAIANSGGITGSGGVVSLYFLALIIIGDLVVLNVFLAIAVDSLDVVLDTIEEEENTINEGHAESDAEEATTGQSFERLTLAEEEIPPFTSLYIFAPKNSFRWACNQLRVNRHFDNFILLCIVVSTICLMVEDPVNADSPTNRVLNYFDFAFLAIFGVEMLVKWVSLGVFAHQVGLDFLCSLNS